MAARGKRARRGIRVIFVIWIMPPKHVLMFT